MKKDWIKRLPPGEYTIQNVLDFAGLISRPSAKLVLIRHGAKIKAVRIEGTNVFRDVFIWKGFKKSNKKNKE